MNLILSLYHGRSSKDEKLDDWGSQGPKLVVDWVQWTYGSLNRISFTKQDVDGDTFNGIEGDSFEFSSLIDDDLFYYDGIWYGDFTLDPMTPVTKAEFFDESLSYLDIAK
jgi:hypothetical protein